MTSSSNGSDPIRRGKKQAKKLVKQAKTGLEIVNLNEVKPENVKFLLPGVPVGMLTMVGGHAGLGKSILTRNWAAEVTRGDLLHRPGGVVVLSGEGSMGMISGHLQAAGANLSFVRSLRLWHKGEEIGITLPDDIGSLKKTVESVAAKLIVIDPINHFFPPNVDYFRDTQVRAVLGPLAHLAEDMGLAIVVVTHLTKSQMGEALHRLGGSIAYGAIVRSVFFWDRDPEDENGELGYQRMLVHAKCNVGALERSSVYKVVHTELRTGAETAYVRHLKDTDYGANEMLGRKSSRDGSESAMKGRVESMLRMALGREGEKIERSQIVEQITQVTGASESTIKRCANEIGVEIETAKTFPRKTIWFLPPSQVKEDGDPTGLGGKSPAKIVF